MSRQFWTGWVARARSYDPWLKAQKQYGNRPRPICTVYAVQVVTALGVLGFAAVIYQLISGDLVEAAVLLLASVCAVGWAWRAPGMKIERIPVESLAPRDWVFDVPTEANKTTRDLRAVLAVINDPVGDAYLVALSGGMGIRVQSGADIATARAHDFFYRLRQGRDPQLLCTDVAPDICELVVELSRVHDLDGWDVPDAEQNDLALRALAEGFVEVRHRGLRRPAVTGIRLTAAGAIFAAALEAPNREDVSMSDAGTAVLRILYVLADPRGGLRLDQESRRVRSAVRLSARREYLDVRFLPAAETDDVVSELVEFRPHVVHFSGHSDEANVLLDSGATLHNEGAVVSMTGLARVLGAVDEPPALVVFNSCESAAALRPFTTFAQFAMGMTTEVDDALALNFAVALYTGIAAGQSVQGAFDLAAARGSIDNPNMQAVPVLESAPGVDPAAVWLMP